jgi:hypothetical protein
MSDDSPRFQFHLSTCLVLVFVLGTIGTLNAIPNSDSVPFGKPLLEHSDSGTHLNYYGFPFSSAVVSQIEGKSPQCFIILESVFLNLVIAAGALWIAFIICERRPRM